LRLSAMWWRVADMVCSFFVVFLREHREEGAHLTARAANAQAIFLKCDERLAWGACKDPYYQVGGADLEDLAGALALQSGFPSRPATPGAEPGLPYVELACGVRRRRFGVPHPARCSGGESPSRASLLPVQCHLQLSNTSLS
jgi:hypothetical protein